MKAFEDFIVSDAFFPVLIGLMVVLVLVFVWILLSGKKKLNKNNIKSEQLQEEKREELDINPLAELEKKELKIVETPEVIVNNTSTDSINDVVVDIPINTMDETPVDVFVPQEELNDVGETVEIEHPTPLVEENVPADQVVDIDIPSLKSEEQGEEVEIPDVKPVVEDSGETVELPVQKVLTNDVGEEAVAFDTIPEANHNINNDIKVEPKQEYTGEKTEIFDFPDFNNIEAKSDDTLTGNVEDDVIKAANNYISTVFKEN